MFESLNRRAPVPAVLRIDVEPDDFQLRGQGSVDSWSGFHHCVKLVEHLRTVFGNRHTAFNPTWLFRMDPEIERIFGRGDFITRSFQKTVRRLEANGDVMGIHVHPYRWDDDAGLVYSEHCDENWIAHCILSSANAFEESLRQPAQRISLGGYFWSNAVLDVEESVGLKVDLTPEPGLTSRGSDPSFGAYATNPSPSFVECPRQPYRPQRSHMFAIAGPRDHVRSVMVVPLTAFDYRSALRPWSKRLAGKLFSKTRSLAPQPLNLWKPWPSPRAYWDLVERAIDEQTVQYCCFAMRSERYSSVTFQRAKSLLEYLPRHPVSKRLYFVDPMSPDFQTLCSP